MSNRLTIPGNNPVINFGDLSGGELFCYVSASSKNGVRPTVYMKVHAQSDSSFGGAALTSGEVFSISPTADLRRVPSVLIERDT